MRSVEDVFNPPSPRMVGDGFRVHNFFPSRDGIDMYRMSPFFLMDYNSPHDFPATDTPPGVDWHPHRGFETVTIAYQGAVEHKDNAGHSGVIREGGVQWMTAASGILHKEFHEKEFAKAGGTFQMVQLWVNLPANDKMNEPRYQGFDAEDLTEVQLPDQKGKIVLIAGEYEDEKGPADTFTPMHLSNLFLNKGKSIDLSFPQDHNTAFLVVKGKVTVNDNTEVKPHHLTLMANDGENFSLTASEDSTILLLSGEPIDEKVVARGPFVMNNEAEIRQAFMDYKSGSFGRAE